MRSILVAQTKGGVGKTTLTFGLAVEAVRAGLSCVVIDADDVQRSLSGLMAKREADAPALAKIGGGSVADALSAPEIASYDVAVIDGPPRLTTDVRGLVKAVDYVLLPIGASPLDVEASSAILDPVRRTGTSFSFVINRADARRAVVGQVRAVLAAAYPVGPIMYERSDWIVTAGSGQSPAEWNASGKAAAEIAELWKYVDTQMRN